MKCPYCNKDMEKGYIKSGQRVLWSRDKEIGMATEDDIKLYKNSFVNMMFNGNTADSFYCPECKIIITPVK